MALTGIGWALSSVAVGFIFLHVSLNLLAYGGASAVNGAEASLKSTVG